jgi:hypothetical protein
VRGILHEYGERVDRVTHNHPDTPDFFLLDKVILDLDERLGAYELPIEVAVKGLDVEAVAFMAHIRARRVAAKTADATQHVALFAAYMDGFTAGVMFQRAKAEQVE